MSKVWYLGVDPGKTGGLGAYCGETQEAEAWRCPPDEYTTKALMESVVSGRPIRLAVMERVGSRPENGVKQAFSFGANVGGWRMALAFSGVPFREITPQEWQRGVFDARAGSKGLDKKKRSLDLARRLFPGVDLRFEKDDGKAEALLMALYASIREF